MAQRSNQRFSIFEFQQLTVSEDGGSLLQVHISLIINNSKANQQMCKLDTYY